VSSPFWLSHHASDQFNRCYRVGPVHICARCLGTYPTLFAFILFQFAQHVPLTHELDFLAIFLVIPATLDWAIGQFKPNLFSNLYRTLTGILLGIALGRSLFVHIQRPLPEILLFQLGFILTAVTLVFFIRYARSRPS
jgi:uncharacterized membrane protein